MSPIVVVLVCLIVIYVLSEFLRIFFVPRVVSQVGAGMLLGLPFISGMLFTSESVFVIKFLAQMGMIVLLFFVGLKIKLREVERDVVPAVWIALCNTFLPLILGYSASRYFFGLDWGVSVIVGLCMSVSATAVALDLLEEFNKLRTRIGTFIVSAGSIDDIFELFLLTGVLTFLGTAVNKIGFLELVGGVIVFAALTVAFRMWLIPFLIHIIEQQPEHAQLFTGALIITLLMVALAEFLGVGALIGALLSGIIIRQILFKEPGHKPWERTEVTHTIHTIAFGFLVPFFFFFVGFQTNIFSIVQNITFGIVITILAIFGTVVGSAIGYYITYRNWREGWIVGWAMNAKGDTELVVASLALSAGAISGAIFSSLIFMAIVSTLISPFVLKPLIKKI